MLAGRVRLILADHEVTMGPGVPHWFGAAGDQPVEILTLLGPHGKRMHVRAAPRRRADA